MSPREIYTLSEYGGKKVCGSERLSIYEAGFLVGIQRITVGSAWCKCNLEKWHVRKQIMETLLMGFHSKLQRRHLSKELPWGGLPRIYFWVCFTLSIGATLTHSLVAEGRPDWERTSIIYYSWLVLLFTAPKSRLQKFIPSNVFPHFDSGKLEWSSLCR